MLDPMQKQRYQERFATVESSFRLEDMDPTEDAVYRDAKAQVLAGTMTPKQALAYVLEASAEHSTGNVQAGIQAEHEAVTR